MISDIFIHLPTSLKYGYVLVRDLINEETMIMFWPRSDIKEVNDWTLWQNMALKNSNFKVVEVHKTIMRFSEKALLLFLP